MLKSNSKLPIISRFFMRLLAEEQNALVQYAYLSRKQYTDPLGHLIFVPSHPPHPAASLKEFTPFGLLCNFFHLQSTLALEETLVANLTTCVPLQISGSKHGTQMDCPRILLNLPFHFLQIGILWIFTAFLHISLCLCSD